MEESQSSSISSNFKMVSIFRSGSFMRRSQNSNQTSSTSLFSKTKTNLKNIKHSLIGKLTRSRTVDEYVQPAIIKPNNLETILNESDSDVFEETKTTSKMSKSTNSLFCSKSLSRSSSTPETNSLLRISKKNANTNSNNSKLRSVSVEPYKNKVSIN